jgi:hypothetical protein
MIKCLHLPKDWIRNEVARVRFANSNIDRPRSIVVTNRMPRRSTVLMKLLRVRRSQLFAVIRKRTDRYPQTETVNREPETRR